MVKHSLIIRRVEAHFLAKAPLWQIKLMRSQHSIFKFNILKFDLLYFFWALLLHIFWEIRKVFRLFLQQQVLLFRIFSHARKLFHFCWIFGNICRIFILIGCPVLNGISDRALAMERLLKQPFFKLNIIISYYRIVKVLLLTILIGLFHHFQNFITNAVIFGAVFSA